MSIEIVESVGDETAPRLEVLIFDVDGTLADTERDGHRAAFNQAFRSAGLDWHWGVDQYGDLLSVAGGKERIRHYCEHFLSDTAERARWTPENIRELHGWKTRNYLELLARGVVPLRPGVLRLIEEARARGVRLAIATTSTPVNVTALLASSLFPEAVSWFDVMVAGDDVTAKKPAPDVYLMALDELGLRPEACLAIEDSEKGLRSATSAGIKTVVTVNEYTRGQDFGPAEMVIDHLGEPDRPFRLLASNVDYAGSGVFDVDLAESILAA